MCALVIVVRLKCGINVNDAPSVTHRWKRFWKCLYIDLCNAFFSFDSIFFYTYMTFIRSVGSFVRLDTIHNRSNLFVSFSFAYPRIKCAFMTSIIFMQATVVSIFELDVYSIFIQQHRSWMILLIVSVPFYRYLNGENEKKKKTTKRLDGYHFACILFNLMGVCAKRK